MDRWTRFWSRVWGMALVLHVSHMLTGAPAWAAPTFPDRGRDAVVDAAHVLSDSGRDRLDHEIVAWVNRTHHQLAVATVPSLDGMEISDYGYQLGRRWGLGSASRNDGVLILVAPHEHRVRIDVGPGLEGTITDAISSLIIHEDMIPRLKQGDVTGAVTAGAEDVMRDAAQQPVQVSQAANRDNVREKMIWVLVGIFAVIAAITGFIYMMVRREQRKSEQRLAQQREAARRDREERLWPARAIYTAESTSTDSASTQPRAPRRPVPPPVDSGSSSGSSVSDISSSSGSSFGSSWDSGSSSSASDSSSSGFDSGGGSFSGGGADGSW